MEKGIDHVPLFCSLVSFRCKSLQFETMQINLFSSINHPSVPFVLPEVVSEFTIENKVNIFNLCNKYPGKKMSVGHIKKMKTSTFILLHS